MADIETWKAAEAAARDRALSAHCPVCHADPGERCRNTVTGQPGNFVHGGRVVWWHALTPSADLPACRDEDPAQAAVLAAVYPDPPECAHPEEPDA